ncbi:MAG: hypothetical protein AAFO75_03635 [Pseudomonadota bacterium]
MDLVADFLLARAGHKSRQELGTRMGDVLFYLLLAIVVAASVVLIAVLARGFLPQQAAAGAKIFGPKPEKRLEVVDQATLDGRRKLILLRRDDKEHLLMIGGPVDVVIETGIPSASKPSSAPGTLGQ